MLQAAPQLIARHAAPVPRYTSYPTALHFTAAVSNLHYVDRLQAIDDDADISLYLHVPFCHELCWYCGCNTKAVQRYAPVARYLQTIEREMATVAQLLTRRHGVTHIHWGGGSPNILTGCHIRQLADKIGNAFNLRSNVEFAVEVDPRHLGEPQVEALAASGVRRVSIGVQDFDPEVQRAINRIQPIEQTRRAVDMFRDHGVGSINVDLVYGLPRQTAESLERTINHVLEIAPDRVATFGYAHLPSRFKHQRLIDGTGLPDAVQRYTMAERIAEMLVAAGYKRIGFDHFARPGDSLAERTVARNFQGYTTDRATALIGIGASAIGRVGGAFVQNATPTADYMRAVEADGLAVARGLILTEDDQVRGYAIEQLMCALEFSASALRQRFGAAAVPVIEEAEALVEGDSDGLVEPSGDGFRVTALGRPFIRTLCATFDSYLRAGNRQYSVGV